MSESGGYRPHAFTCFLAPSLMLVIILGQQPVCFQT